MTMPNERTRALISAVVFLRDLRQAGRTRVAANPAGHILNRIQVESSADFDFESLAFDPNLVLEV